jgi:hypothetical protein
MSAFQRFVAELFVVGGAVAPGGAPVVIAFERAGDLFEFGQQQALCDKTRSPN